MGSVSMDTIVSVSMDTIVSVSMDTIVSVSMDTIVSVSMDTIYFMVHPRFNHVIIIYYTEANVEQYFATISLICITTTLICFVC